MIFISNLVFVKSQTPNQRMTPADIMKQMQSSTKKAAYMQIMSIMFGTLVRKGPCQAREIHIEANSLKTNTNYIIVLLVRSGRPPAISKDDFM